MVLGVVGGDGGSDAKRFCLCFDFLVWCLRVLPKKLIRLEVLAFKVLFGVIVPKSSDVLSKTTISTTCRRRGYPDRSPEKFNYVKPYKQKVAT